MVYVSTHYAYMLHIRYIYFSVIFLIINFYQEFIKPIKFYFSTNFKVFYLYKRDTSEKSSEYENMTFSL